MFDFVWPGSVCLGFFYDDDDDNDDDMYKEEEAKQFYFTKFNSKYSDAHNNLKEVILKASNHNASCPYRLSPLQQSIIHLPL